MFFWALPAFLAALPLVFGGIVLSSGRYSARIRERIFFDGLSELFYVLHVVAAGSSHRCVRSYWTLVEHKAVRWVRK
jgi:uncharacterized membrane protein